MTNIPKDEQSAIAVVDYAPPETAGRQQVSELDVLMLVGQVERRLENVYATLAALKVQFDREVPELAYKADLAALHQIIEARLGAFLTKSELHVFFDRISEVRKEVGAMSAEVRSSMAALETRLEKSWSQLSTELNGRLGALERDGSETKRVVGDAGASAGALRERLQSIAENQSSATSEMRRETERLRSQVQGIAEAQSAAVGDLRVETEKVRTEVANIGGEVRHSVNRAVVMAVAAVLPIAALVATVATIVIKHLNP